MRIKTRLRINSAIAFILMLVVVFFFVQFRQRTIQMDRNLALVEEMGKIAFERTELRDEYLANQSERAKLLWEKKTDRFRILLEEGKGSFRTPSDQKTIEEIGEAFQGTIPLFYKLAGIAERENNIHRKPTLFLKGKRG